ncbi:MAG TPA: hypothetical protein VNM91_00955 [Dehalococcoidia bacterium]|nr:hypothetical protein [Dehalococcoidia bacterium]
MIRVLVAIAVCAAMLPAGMAAQSPTADPTETPTPAVTGAVTPLPSLTPAAPPPPAPVTPAGTPGVVPNPRVIARLPVPPGTAVTFDILSESGTIVVCATTTTVATDDPALSLVDAVLPDACAAGIVRCPLDAPVGPCVRLTARLGDDPFSELTGFVPGSTFDLGTLAPFVPQPIAPPDAGSRTHHASPHSGTLGAAAIALAVAATGLTAISRGLRRSRVG